jgi:hypothetical protein
MIFPDSVLLVRRKTKRKRKKRKKKNKYLPY